MEKAPLMWAFFTPEQMAYWRQVFEDRARTSHEHTDIGGAKITCNLPDAAHGILPRQYYSPSELEYVNQALAMLEEAASAVH